MGLNDCKLKAGQWLHLLTTSETVRFPEGTSFRYRVTSFLIPLLWASFPRHIEHYLCGSHLSQSLFALRKCGDPPSLAVLRPSIVCGLRLLHREDLDLWCTGAKSIFVTKNESPDAPYLILYSVLYHHVSSVSLLVSLEEIPVSQGGARTILGPRI